MKILLDLQNSMRAVTLNSEFSLCGLIIMSRVPIHKSIRPTDEVIMMNNDETYDEIRAL